MPRRMVIIDTETTGLDFAVDEVVEVAWVDADDPDCDIKRLVIPHSLQPDPKAAEVNGYYQRGLDDTNTWAEISEIRAMYADLEGAQLVGANVAFDAHFLRRYARDNYLKNPEPWHYRMLDIESMAYGLGDFEDVPGMKTIYDQFSKVREELGMEPIPAPDHTAEGDVRATYHLFQQLRALRVPATAVA